MPCVWHGKMNELNRGTPKKRLLWRQLHPTSGTSSTDANANDEDSGETSTAKLKTACRLDGNHEKNSDFQETSSLVSPPLSEEEDANSVSSSNIKVQAQQESLDRMVSSSEQFHSESSQYFLCDIESGVIERGAIGEDAPCLPASSDPSLTTFEGGSISHSESIVEPCSDAVATDASHLVVSTAASVLLLMRFSVTDQALDSLRTGSSSETEVVAKHALTEKQEEGPTPVEATSTTSLVTLPSQREPPSLRRVSMPEDTRLACPRRLAMPEDPNELNSLHCFVRAHLLEVFGLPPQKDKPGRVGLRCVFCSHLPRKDRSGTTMCTFYPKSLQDLYRSVMTWQRIHFKCCQHVSPEIRQEYWKNKEDQSRGKTTYWVTSAMRLGLQDISGRTGICFVSPAQAGSAS